MCSAQSMSVGANVRDEFGQRRDPAVRMRRVLPSVEMEYSNSQPVSDSR